MRRVLVLACVLAGLARAAAPEGDGATTARRTDGGREVASLLAELERGARDVRTLAGEFTQRNRSKLFKKELRSSGRLYFQRPRRIRWEYREPDPSTLILDGQRATLTTPGAAPQVFDLERDATMRAVFDQLLTWLAPGGLGEAGREYTLSTSGGDAAPTLTLTPKAGGAVARAFARIDLRVDAKAHLVRAIALTERNGDTKEITFTRLEANAQLPADAFR
jgi:outer membrane lipoprotein carrier protein